MASAEEIQFSKDRYRLQDMVLATYKTLEICLGLQFASSSGSLDSVTGPILGDTLADQVLVLSREYWRGNFGDKSRIEVAIGHNDKWRPVVTATPPGELPTSVVFETGLGS